MGACMTFCRLGHRGLVGRMLRSQVYLMPGSHYLLAVDPPSFPQQAGAPLLLYIFGVHMWFRQWFAPPGWLAGVRDLGLCLTIRAWEHADCLPEGGSSGSPISG